MGGSGSGGMCSHVVCDLETANAHDLCDVAPSLYLVLRVLSFCLLPLSLAALLSYPIHEPSHHPTRLYNPFDPRDPILPDRRRPVARVCGPSFQREAIPRLHPPHYGAVGPASRCP